MITYHVESFATIQHETPPLFEKHWSEVAVNKDVIKLDFNYDACCKMDADGKLHTVTVRNDGALVGYHISIVMPHLHYRQSLSAFVDIYYISPEHRKGGVGTRLFKYAEETLRARGVQRIYTSCKLSLDIGPLFERLGYTAIERNYSKILSSVEIPT